MPDLAASTVWQHAARAADVTARLPGGVPMFFRRIPPGSFLMGSRGEHADEEPAHRVVIAREFFLGTFVVTQEQYRAVAKKCAALKARAEPSDFKGPRRPVESVDWNEATAFCDWLTQSGLVPAGFAACLPTEAQWEHACRAGSVTEYYNGDGAEALAEIGWYDENSGNETHPVDEKIETHPFGLFGMHGNVWEWCRDGWDADAYKERVDGVVEPFAAPEGYPPRVLRGGSWDCAAGVPLRGPPRGRARQPPQDLRLPGLSGSRSVPDRARSAQGSRSGAGDRSRSARDERGGAGSGRSGGGSRKGENAARVAGENF